MSTPPRMMFNAFVQLTPGHHFEGLWRSPWGQENPYDELDTWIGIAKRIEAAKFDGLFIADTMGLYGAWGGDHRAHAEGAISFPEDDAIIMAAALAAVTENLSLGFTSALIQNYPFEFARLASTVDRVTKGRAAWNIVPGSTLSSHRNVGIDEVPSNADRYARAEEYLDVVFSLWEGSWALDAVVKDAERGVYADPSKIFRINHASERFKVTGPHMNEPTPQRVPFLYTAGVSSNSVRLAAKYAEAMLMQVRTPQDAAGMVKDLGTYAREYGRRAEDIKVIQALHFVVGSTEEEAKRKWEENKEYINPRGTLVESAGILGMDLSGYDLDEEVDISSAPGFHGIFGEATLGKGRTTATPREIAAAAAVPPVVGTPEQIADVIEQWRDAGVTGINVGDYLFSRAYVDFADHVMPELQKRGIAQREYAPGTVREKVFGDGPFLNERHPAAKLRGAFTDAIG
ncbi:LLM class flavin-dependent oxidoreductase [Microbacterium paludicola]|uniref:LLM class flavin-dependent oxidoreductase n=1 Tax=Microbacterium paludicola TaxID=300019 RepID=A0A4Y9FV52_9MICO|nr:NtaA/DmoA family FMN-dependent monooxygenase [Microbacterium paludicola]MBF0817172.1 NtaA/DmoA family FMN-dependent monooxygenase [Microbacterium paludicola]TFU32100.1 LLM class flavin-dependent oxidoreductase [Microbacterium paludicola]